MASNRVSAAILVSLCCILIIPVTLIAQEPDFSGDRTEPWVIPSTPGVPWSWGSGSWGQLGNGGWGSSYTPVQVSLPAGTTFKALDSGYYHGLGLTDAGTLLAWGWNNYGQVGNGNNTNQNTPVPVSVPAGTVITAIAAGAGQSFAVTSTGQVLAWGSGTLGSLGNGASSDSNVPVWVSLPAGVVVTDVAAGDCHAIALTSDGRVLGWGYNTGGQLGNGTWTTSNVPVWASLPAGTVVTKIFSGDYQCFALTNTGAVLGWGHNAYGELGDGTNAYKNTPTPISFPAGTTITDISGGNGHSIFLTGAGTVLATGDNSIGQLGNGTGSNSNVPVPVSLPAGAVITDVEANQAHCLALKSTGTILAWGYNNGGQLGDGTTTNRPLPVDVLNLKWVLALAAGSAHSLATVTPCPTITVTNPAVATGTVNAFFSESFTNSGGFAPVTFSTGSALPAGLTLAADGTLSGTPTVKGTFPITVTAKDSHDCTGTGGVYNLVISCQGITVSNPAVTVGTVGSPFSQTFTQTGGLAPVTFSTASALPAGLSLASDGTLGGTPTATGLFPISVTATDTNDCAGTGPAYDLLICPIITLSPATLPDGTRGAAYSQTIAASGCGGSCSFAVTAGALPAGLSLDSGTGALTGTPTATGTSNFTVTATDTNGCTGSRAYTVLISCPTVVTNPNDSGEGSLRWVVQWTCTGATVTFAPGVTGAIPLSTGAIPVTRTLTIQGPGASVLAVDGGGLDRVFNHTAGTLSISGLTVRNGSASIHGGGIYSSAPLSLTECVISGCVATTGANAGGAGVYAQGGLTMDRCTVSGNQMQTAGYGGGLEVNVTPGVLTNCTFSGNHAPGSGGGLMVANTTCTLLNCTITQNTVAAVNPGGGIAVLNATLNLKNSIVAGNAGQAGQQIFTSASTVNDNGGNFTSGDPRVAPLAGYGGPTPTHPLLCGSPALDIGVAGYPATDQRSVPRPQSGVADSGAFENLVSLSPGTLPAGQTGVAYSQALTGNGGTGPWIFTAVGTLPPGLSLAADGQITGTPTALGSWTFDVVAWESDGYGGVCRYTIVITCGTIAVSPSSLSSGTAGTAYPSVTFTQTGGIGTITWSESGALPAGMSFNAPTATLSGTPTVSGTFPITVTAADANGCTGSQGYSLVISCPTIMLAALTNGTASTVYNSSAAASPAGTYEYAMTAGSLPPGLTLNPSTGAVTGTPTTNGTYNFTIAATGWGTCTGNHAYTLTIACPTITLAALPNGTVKAAYSSSAVASPAGTTYSYAVTAGSLPPGLTLNASTGDVTGTPTTNGTYNFTVTATGWGTCTGSQAYTISIACPTITLAALANGTSNTPYNGSAVASPAGTYTYALTAGSLPPGLSLNTSTGAVTGTPTANGTYTFTITATGWGTCTGSQAYTLTIACPTITLSPASPLPGATVGTVPYSQTFSAAPTGTTYAYSVTAGALPPGLTLNPTTGVLSGTVTAAGTFSFTITATGWGTCTGSQAYTLNAICPTVTVSPASLPGGVVGAPYAQTFAASGGNAPYTFSLAAGTLPPGLTLAPTGALSGTPALAGTYTFSVLATDGYLCAGMASYTVSMVCPAISLSPSSLPGTLAGTPYTQTLTAIGGTAPYTYVVTGGALPGGLALNPDGTLAGTPTANGTFTFTVTATDANGCAGSITYTVFIAAFDLTFYDDYGRSALCVNSATGAFTYKVLYGFGVGSYGGVGVITRYNGVMYLRTPVGSPVYLYLTYLERYHRAQASFKNTPMRISSTLYDNNTLNNPAVCAP